MTIRLVKKNNVLDLSKPSTGTNDYNKLDNKPSINGNELKGNLTTDDLGIEAGGLKDVIINGASIVSDGVADIPTLNDKGAFGIPKIWNVYGVTANDDGYLQILKADNNNINSRDANYRAIVPTNLDYAVKCAMTDGKGTEWTDEEKQNARERLGLEWTLLGDVTVEEDGVTKIEIPIDNPNYNEYQVYIYVNRVSNPSSNTLVVNFGDLTTSTYALLNNGVGTKTEVYLRGIIQRHANNGWISWYVSSHDKQVLTGISGRGGQYSEAWKTDAPSKINVSLATGLDVGSKFIVYAR